MGRRNGGYLVQISKSLIKKTIYLEIALYVVGFYYTYLILT